MWSFHYSYITYAPGRLKAPAIALFVHRFVYRLTQRKQSSRYWPFVMGIHRIPLTKGQLGEKSFHVVTSICMMTKSHGNTVHITGICVWWIHPWPDMRRMHRPRSSLQNYIAENAHKIFLFILFWLYLDSYDLFTNIYSTSHLLWNWVLAELLP